MADKRLRPGWAQIIWHNIFRTLCTSIICPLYLVRAYGMSNVPKKGGALILCNHQSFLDPMFSQSWVRRNFSFVARDTLFEGFFGKLIGWMYTIPIRRGEADLAAMKAIIARAKEGAAVCLYPEATRTHDGKIVDIKAGFGLLARRSKASVVPMVIEGAFDCWPRTRKFPRLGKVVVMYGEAITSEQINELDNETFAQMVTDRMRSMQNECRKKMGKDPLDYSGVSEVKGVIE